MDPLITKWILSEAGLGATSVEDFLFSATKQEDLGSVAESAGVEQGRRLLMTSRIRQAWTSLKKAAEDADSLKRKSLDDVELDDLLPQRELDDMGAKHYARYRMSWPPEIMPSDQLISRVSKEMTKRLLGVTSIWKVKTQAMQLKSVRKRTKVGDLEVLHGESANDEEPAKDVTHYLNGLHSLLIAYSIPGVKSRDGAAEDYKGADTCKVVECPLDILMRYYFRVQSRASELPKSEALNWLVKHDEADRSQWVDKFRNTQMTLGEVVQITLVQREAMWEVPLWR